MIFPEAVLLAVGQKEVGAEPTVQIVVASGTEASPLAHPFRTAAEPPDTHLRIVVNVDNTRDGARISEIELAALAAGIQRILDERKGAR